MPNIKSAKKRVKTAARNRIRNAAAKSQMRSRLKAATKVLVNPEGDAASRASLVKQALATVDRLAAKGTIHPRQAARRKSRLMHKAS